MPENFVAPARPVHVDPATEKVPISFDWSDFIPDGDELKTCTWEAIPATLAIRDAEIDPDTSIARCKISASGCVAGDVILLRATATGGSGIREPRTIRVECAEK
jgi:hypothetical protein